MTTCTIRINEWDFGGGFLWEKEILPDEYKRVKGYCVPRKVRNPIIGMLMPVRTNTLENFAKDFFFPTVYLPNDENRTVQYTMRAVCDIVTFPARLITVIPRIFVNAMKREHPLHQYLREENVGQEILHSDYVYIQLQDNTGNRDLRTVNFIEMPLFAGNMEGRF